MGGDRSVGPWRWRWVALLLHPTSCRSGGADDEQVHGAATVALGPVRERLVASRTSFITETVFSDRSKVELVRRAASAGYLVYLHVLIVPAELAVARVAQRVEDGGHNVPEDKIRERHARLWGYVADAMPDAYDATVYDSSGGRFLPVVRFRFGTIIEGANWSAWTPQEPRAAAD